MKVVAGSHGNDAIGPLTMDGGGVMVCPHEWGPRTDGSGHFDHLFSVHSVGCALSKVRRELRPFGALSHDLIAVEARRLRYWR